MRLALIPQGFTARGCYVHYVPHKLAAAEGLGTFIFEVQRASRPTQLNDTAVKNGAIARNCIGIFALRVRGFPD